LAGDADFIWNKTTNLLTVTGAATITGDLTVDTSTLKVDSANNRVGIGTATPTDTLDVNGRVTAARFLSSSSSASLPALAVSSGNGVYNSGTNEVGFSVNSTLAMTLNSTGLGVGRSPLTTLDAYGANKTNTNENGILTVSSSDSYAIDKGGSIAFFGKYNSASGNACFARIYGAKENSTDGSFTGYFAVSTSPGGTPIERFRIDSSGNLGLGVTPSAWLSTYKSFQFGIGGSLIGRTNDAGIELSSNTYRNTGGTYLYLNTDNAASYRQYTGQHQWWNAASGTAGNAITFVQAMTLDASGNLCVGTATAVRKLTIYDTTATPAQFESSTTDCQLTLVTSSGSGGKCFIQASAGALLLGSSASERARIDANGNFMVGVSAAGTTAAKTIQIANGTAPTANITGGQLYVEAGALKYRGSSGTVTTIANA